MKPDKSVAFAQHVIAKDANNEEALLVVTDGAYQHKQYDAAIAEFKSSVDSAATPEPATIVRLANAYNEAGKYDLALATADRAVVGHAQMPDRGA